MFISRMRQERSSASPAYSVAQTFASRVALLVINFGTGVIVARVLGPAGRGDQTAMSLWPILLAGMLTLGVPTALTFRGRSEPDQLDPLVLASLVIALVLGCIAGTIGYFLMPSLLKGYSPSVISEARILLLFTPQIGLTGVIRGYYQSRKNFANVNAMTVVPPAVTLGILALLAIRHELTVSATPFAYYWPTAVQTVWLTVSIGGTLRSVSVQAFKKAFRSIYAYGVRVYGVDVVFAVSTQIDQGLVVHFLSARAVGLYAVALSLSRIISMIDQSIVSVLFSSVVGLDKTDALLIIGRSARVAGVIAFIGGAAFIVAIPIILPLVYGHAYDDATLLIQILTGEAVISCVSAVLWQAFAAVGRPFAVTSIQALWLVTVVVLISTFVQLFGLPGAAVALLIATGIRLIVVMLAYKLVLKSPVPSLIPLRSDLIYVISKVSSIRHAFAT